MKFDKELSDIVNKSLEKHPPEERDRIMLERSARFNAEMIQIGIDAAVEKIIQPEGPTKSAAQMILDSEEGEK